MPRVARTRVRRYLRTADRGATTVERGRALEDLVSYVFGTIPGIAITRRNQLNVFATEEIDVALWNDPHPEGLIVPAGIILVECKNWSSPVGSAEVAWFDTKLRNRGLSLGILIATSGITGSAAEQTAAHSIVANALREKRQIIVITRAELQAVASSSQLARLIKEKLCDLAVSGAVFITV